MAVDEGGRVRYRGYPNAGDNADQTDAGYINTQTSVEQQQGDSVYKEFTPYSGGGTPNAGDNADQTDPAYVALQQDIERQRLESAKQNLLALGGQLGDNSVQQALSDIAAGGNIDQILQVEANLLAAVNKAKADQEAVRKKAQNSLKAKFARNFLKPVLNTAEDVFEPIQRAYYAGKRAQLQGLSTFDQTRAEIGGLPGLGFLAGNSEARRAIEETNSRQEREALRKKGELASFGEFVTGRAADPGHLRPDLIKRAYGGEKPSKAPTPIRGLLSGALDLGFQVFSDPTLGALSSGAKVGEVAAEAGVSAAKRAGLNLTEDVARQAGRRAFLGGRTGMKLVEAVVAAAREARDVTALRKAVRGMEAPVAKDILEAARTGGEDAVRSAVQKAFEEGVWNPHVGVTRQLTRLGVGRAAVPRGLGIVDATRGLVRGAGEGRATGASHAADQALERTLQRSTERAKIFAGDIKTPGLKLPGEGKSLNLMDYRLNRLERFAAQSDVAAFKDAVAEQGGRIRGLAGRFRVQPAVARPTAEALSEADRLITRLERVQVALEGGLGEAAKKQARAELQQGFKLGAEGGRELVEQAARNVNWAIPQTTAAKVSKPALKAAEAAIKQLDPELQPGLLEDLAKAAKSKKGLGLVNRTLDLLSDPDVLDEARRLAGNVGDRLAQDVTPAEARAGLGKRLAQGAGKALLSINESVAPGSVPFEGSRIEGHRVEQLVGGIDRWAQAVGLDDFTRSAVRQGAQSAKTERQVFEAIEQGLRRLAEKEGVDADELIAVYRANRAAAKAGTSATRAFGVDASGTAIRDKSFTQAQLISNIPLFDPADIKKSIKFLKEGGPHDLAARMAAAEGDKSKLLKAATEILKKGHYAWKLNVVSGAYMPVLGAAAGIGFTDGSIGDRLKAGAVGAGIGMFGPARYILRVPIGEERILRYYMERGFTRNFPEWVPVMSKWWAKRGVDVPFESLDLVRASKVGETRIGGAFATKESGTWVVLGKNESRFLDGWARIVNSQIHPESDELAKIFLNAKAGNITDVRAMLEAKQFLKTDAGRLMRERLADGVGGTGSIKEIISRYKTFVDTHVNPDLAQIRLQKAASGAADQFVTREELKAIKKAGFSPDFVHAERSWVMPKNAGQVRETRNNILAKFVFEGPTSKINREPLAQHLYRDEFLRLRRDGVETLRAAELADDYAVSRTNQIMFKVEDESRFAKKIDFISPFQQPKEELFRVWGRLAKENPSRALRAPRLAALAFNNGQENGTFKKDAFGQYRLSLPQGKLASAVIGVNANFDVSLKDMLFFTQGAYGNDLGVGVPFPTPGGPWIGAAEKLWATHNPDDYENMPKWLKGALFPYGASGALGTGPERRLWMGITGDAPPWEFVAKEDQEDQLRKWQVEIDRQLRYQHGQETGDWNWEPPVEEVKNATKSFFKLWAFIGSTAPAAPQPTLQGQEAYSAVIKAHTSDKIGLNGKPVIDWDGVRQDFPLSNLYLTKDDKYVGPDDFKSWSQQDEHKSEQYITEQRRHLSLDEFRQEFKDAQRRSDAYKEFSNILKGTDPWSKEANLQDWRAKYPELAKDYRADYFKEQRLQDILRFPESSQQQLLDSWRKEYNVTPKELAKMRQKLQLVSFQKDPWKEARYSEDVVADVEKQVRRGMNEEAYVSTLLPAEQVMYWKAQQSQLAYWAGSSKDDPANTVSKYKQYGKYISDLYGKFPELLGPPKNKTIWQKAVDDFKGDVRKQIAASYEEINRISPSMNEAAQAKNWTAYYALKAKRDALFDQIEALQNSTYKSIPEMNNAMGDLVAILALAQGKKLSDYYDLDALRKSSGINWVSSDEESSYLAMPDGVRRAFVQDLTNDLDKDYGESGKKYWSYLTNFQKDLLEKNLPADKLYAWKRLNPGDDKPAKSGSSTYYKSGGSFGGKFYQGTTIGTGAGELAYALEMFKQYDRRNGMAKPAAWDAYMALPNNPGVRAQFIKEHPDVAEYIKLGPLSNMPELDRMIVTNIMVKYGKWEGEEKSIGEITDLAFAREQLSRWSRRPAGASAPDSYDLWLNMPSGPEKAQFLKSHPEIADWLKLGPMANMPDEYRSVVRDIMFRYGEWTQQQDALGDTIAEYYRTPKAGQKKFLEDHPELTAYWAALRTPEEQRLHDMADNYFAMQGVEARRAYLSANPDLQQFFVDARTKRYETFLNQVAQFMGANPELFTQYLDRQSDILAELLKRYAEPHLMRETPRGVTKVQTRSATRKAA